MYANGKGVSKNYSKAIEFYTKAADQGFANAQFELGRMYANGYGVPQNYSKAIEFYKKAAIKVMQVHNIILV